MKYSWCSKITLAFCFIFLLFFFYILYNQSLLHVHMEFGLIIAFIFTINIFPLLDLEISRNIVQKLLFPATYFGCASHLHLFSWLPILGLVILIWMISTVYIWCSLRQQMAGVILIMLDKYIHMYLSWSSLDLSQVIWIFFVPTCNPTKYVNKQKLYTWLQE